MANTLDEGYKAMASDSLREAQAAEWCDALATVAGQQSKAGNQIKLVQGLPEPELLAAEDAIRVQLGLAR